MYGMRARKMGLVYTVNSTEISHICRYDIQKYEKNQNYLARICDLWTSIICLRISFLLPVLNLQRLQIKASSIFW